MRSIIEVQTDLLQEQNYPVTTSSLKRIAELKKELKRTTAHFVATLEAVEEMLLDLPSPVSDELDHKDISTLQVADAIAEVTAAVEKCDCL